MSTMEPNDLNQKVSIGIDLGTTFSSIAFYNLQDKQPTLVKLSESNKEIPSCIAMNYREKTAGMSGKILSAGPRSLCADF